MRHQKGLMKTNLPFEYIRVEMSNDLKTLCLSLIQADQEDNVIELLKSEGYWKDATLWRDLGDNENNYSVAGAQQADPVAALVEKLVNSADARLMNACLEAKILPDDPDAPPSMRHAVAQFIEGSSRPERETEGLIENWTNAQRRKEAKKITLAVTGQRSDPSITIVDEGEGQTPDNVPETFMSLNKANKLRVPFVQGKFNMGGTGVLRFCGHRRIQLVITRRNPVLVNSSNPEDHMWSFTVVRRDEPRRGERSSVYRYLAPLRNDREQFGRVLRFPAEELFIWPNGNKAYHMPAKFGSLIKLYNYKYKGQSHILLPDGLARAVDVRLPNPALPVMFHECRNYSGDSERSFENPNTGLLVRIEDDRAGNIEEGFPVNAVLVVDGQKMKVRFYGFKKGKAKSYLTKSEGVIFTVNGQTQGVLPARFFTRKKIAFDSIATSLLACVDCSELERRAQEELFMNTRESLAESEFRFKLESALEKLVKEHPALREFCNRRREENIREKIEDNASFEETLKKIMQRSPTLSALFLKGQRLSDPFKTKGSSVKEQFEGKEFPTFFRFKDLQDGVVLQRTAEKGRAVRIRFETDMENNYFGRSKAPGDHSLICREASGKKVVVLDYSLNPFNGIATLNIDLPKSFNVGDVAKLELIVTDENRLFPFINTAKIKVVPFVKKQQGGKNERTKPPSNEQGDERLTPSGLAIPETYWVKEEEWAEYEFTKESAICVERQPSDDEDRVSYLFYLNEANIHLLREMKHGDSNIVKEQFRIGIVLIALAVIHSCKDSEDGEEIRKKVEFSCSAISMMLIPLMNALNALGAGDLPSEQEAA